MARGKKRTQTEIESFITKIENYLKIGCSLKEACTLADVPYTTILDYKKADRDIRAKIEGYEGYAVAKARQSVVKNFDARPDLALRYLEKKLKGEFGDRMEIDHTTKGDKIETLSASDKAILDTYIKSQEK